MLKCCPILTLIDFHIWGLFESTDPHLQVFERIDLYYFGDYHAQWQKRFGFVLVTVETI